MWRRHVDTKSTMNDKREAWKRSRARMPHEPIPTVDVARPFLESPVDGLEEESSYSDPVTPEEHAHIQREGFDSVEDGEDPDCGHVTGAPAMRRIRLEELRKMAAFEGDPTPVIKQSSQRRKR